MLNSGGKIGGRDESNHRAPHVENLDESVSAEYFETRVPACLRRSDPTLLDFERRVRTTLAVTAC